ncbi:MAG: uracil-DNA glycosylase [Vicinamibacterales bacterium]
MSEKDVRAGLADHLRLYAQFGVDGVSRDPAWRRRTADEPEAPAAEDAAAASTPAAEEGAGTPETLETVRDALGACTRCKLHALGRRQIVFGAGNPRAELMFIGEAPGHDEDSQGVPFVGRAGQLLTKIIEAIGLTRDEVYIANVIKCRPPGNRNPEPDEVASCEPFLLRQVQIIKPQVIVALGTFAAQTLLRTNDPISRLRGKVFRYGAARLVPTFHPAYLLRSPERKREVWEDMKKVRALLRGEDAGGGDS